MPFSKVPSVKVIAAGIVAVGLMIALWRLILPPSPKAPSLPAVLAGKDPMVMDLVGKTIARIEADPDNPHSWMALGYVYEANDLDSLALACYRTALSLDDAPPKWWYRLARIRMQLGDRPGAVEAVNKVIALGATYGPAHWRLGYIYLEQNELERAQQQFEHAMAVDAQDAAGPWGLARVWLQKEEPRRALAVLEEMPKESRDRPYSHLLLGTAYRRLGRLEEARKHLDQELERQPQYRDLWDEELKPYRAGLPHKIFEAVAMIEDGDMHDATGLLEELQRNHPDDLTVLNNLAGVYVSQKRFREALRLFNSALRNHPHNAYLHLNAASVYRKLKQPARAVQHLDRVIALDPRLGGAIQQKGEILTSVGNHPEAAGAYQQAIELEPRDAALHVGLGLARLELEQWADGLASFQQAVELDSTLVRAHLGTAVAAKNLRQLAEAETALLAAQALIPSSTKIQAMLAQIRELGNEGAQE